MKKPKSILNRHIVILSAGLFIASLCFKSYCIEDNCADAIGSFILGTIGFVMGGALICWLANPFIFLSWIVIKKFPVLSWILSGIALSTGLLFMTFDRIIINEAGHYSPITGYASGYWLWIISIATIFLWNSYKLLYKRFGILKK
ncbi:hypothetical protein [Zunongwangia profunda]|uniref:hypothetical protein n=1 Tax=Zunongwangia profunda TaxID=398743 RepID=UPI001D186350|nr:hypothetical protein [Zunongwangia profunda]MCC4228699.1 hypothetical protein [Zunongwangia profunda]